MQTHKNPELRGQGAPEPKAKSPPKPAAKPAAAVSSIHIPNLKLHRIAFFKFSFSEMLLEILTILLSLPYSLPSHPSLSWTARSGWWSITSSQPTPSPSLRRRLTNLSTSTAARAPPSWSRARSTMSLWTHAKSAPSFLTVSSPRASSSIASRHRCR